MSKSNDDLLSDTIDTHNQSSELDVFTLLEENIALKEKIEELMAKHNARKHLQLNILFDYYYLVWCFVENSSNNFNLTNIIYLWAVLQKNIQLERDNVRVGKQFSDLKVQQKQLKDQLQGLMDKFQKEVEEGQTIHNIQEQQRKIINE